jgi:hypothetical protein
MAQGFRLPAYEMPQNALLNFRPINDAIATYNQQRQLGVENERQNKLLAFREQQMGMDRERFGLEQQRFTREMERAKTMDPLEAERARAGIDQTRASTAASQAQLSQLKMQTPDYRASVAGKYGLTPGTSEYNQFVLNGQFAPPDPIRDLIRGAIPPTATPPAAMPPGGQPRLQQQSMPGQPDQPQLIPAQVSQPPQAPQQAPEAMVDTPLGRMPESRAKVLGFALALQGKGEAGKMMAGEPGLGKTAMNDVDEKIVKSLDQIGRLEGMAQTFQDKYQTIGTRLGMTATGWMAKIDPTKVKPEDARDLAAFAQDRRRGIENLNLTIKDITGAAMSIPEAQRIMQQVPNPGTGIFDGDDPVTYRAKLSDALDQTRLALARNSWLKRNNPQLLNQLAARKMEGVENVMPLDRMRDVMNERKNQIFQELRQRAPNATPQQLLPFVGQQLKQEFGI